MRYRTLADRLDNPEPDEPYPDEISTASQVGTNLKYALQSLSDAERALQHITMTLGFREAGEPAWYQRMRRRAVMLRWLCDRLYARTGASYALMPKRWAGEMVPLPPKQWPE